MEFIKSKENKLYKTIKKLKTRKYREKEKLFIAEGQKFLDFKETPWAMLLKEGDNRYIEKAEGFTCPKYILSEALFNELSSQENSQGILLIYSMCESSIETIGHNIVVLDRIQDPGNLGTIIRVADAAGYRDIILLKGSVDVYNEKTVRSSMGSLFNMNFIYMEEEEVIKFIDQENYKSTVTALREDAIPYTDIIPGSKNAIIFGNEGQGVSERIIESSHSKVIIPIYGLAESLNVAVAAGIVLYKFRELLI
ncbi:RNA methyltransferase [uncultured Ilyobacter sp.]|uniref:TrmH family RNA methyltransferase n=1 Tax=uncultured Ilyobacter sp. TaxID=544433 RepID=UPI0029C8B108|nr:RNA methyltransferase [uncultured Ilyobacter sp.]